VISSRCKVREEVETEGTDCSDRFPAFSARFSSYKYPEGFKPIGITKFSSYKYPEGFKPIGITKYDGKQAPQQWLRCYSTAIEVVGGSKYHQSRLLPDGFGPCAAHLAGKPQQQLN
jgi:hypothetical protein